MRERSRLLSWPVNWGLEGISFTNKWKEATEQHGETVFPGQGRRCARGTAAEEITRLKRELIQVKEENEILKKAAAFFARELK
jgi:transposase